MKTMRAHVFHGVGRTSIEQVPIPEPKPGEALVRVTLTTICGTDLHIVRGEYPVKPGLVIGHEPVGVIAELGAGITGYNIGLWAVPCLPVCPVGSMWPRRRS